MSGARAEHASAVLCGCARPCSRCLSNGNVPWYHTVDIQSLIYRPGPATRYSFVVRHRFCLENGYMYPITSWGGLRNLEMRSSQLESGFTPLGLLNSSSTAHLPRRAPAGCARRVPYGALAYSPKTRLCALSGACFECPCARVPVFGSDLCLAYLQTFFPA